MRIILILIVIFAIFAVVQSKRHNCELGTDDWFDCVVSNTQKEFLASSGTSLSPERPAAGIEVAAARLPGG